MEYFLLDLSREAPYRAVNKITSAEMAQFHRARKDAPVRANRLLATISSMFGFAARRDLVPKGFNPAAGIDKFPEQRREGFLTREEIGRLGETLRLAESAGLPWNIQSKGPKSKHLAKEANQRSVLMSRRIF